MIGTSVVLATRDHLVGHREVECAFGLLIGDLVRPAKLDKLGLGLDRDLTRSKVRGGAEYYLM